VQTADYTLNLDTIPPITTASPAGGTYTSAQSVTLTANETATIYYTVDGATPTVASTVYSGAIPIPASTTLKFFARDTAGNSEAVQTAVYTIDATPPVTTAAPAGGTYTSAQSVTLTATETATIYYTVDGATPTTASPVFSGAIAIPASTTLKFFARDTAGNSEAVQTAVYTIDATLPVTTAAPAGGTYTSAQSVTLTANEPATIYYTTNGSAPTISSPVYSGAIAIPSTSSLKFFARDAAGNSEAVQTAVYTIDTIPPVTTAAPAGGTYTSAQSVTLTTSEAATIYYTVNSSTPTTASPVYSGAIAIPTNTTLKFFAKDTAGNSEAVQTAVYTIDTIPPVTTASPAGGIYTSARNVTLTASEAATIYYTLNDATPTTASPVYSGAIPIPASTTLKFFAKDAAGNSEAVQTAVYTIDTIPPVTTASPAGGTYTSAQSVTLTASEAATIYYTVNNSTPTTASQVYSGAIAIPASTTLKFFAKDAAGNSEAVQTALYTIDATPPVTTAAPAGGTYSAAQSVTLTASEPATIYYTTNGSAPTFSSPVYSGAITIPSTSSLKFFARDTAGNSETVRTESYTIKLNQTITFGTLPAKTYGDGSFIVSATSSSGLPVSFTSSNSAVAIVSGSTITIIGAGTATITASQGGDGTYNPATTVAQTLSVAKVVLTVQAADATRPYGEANPAFSATYSGFINADTQAVLSGSAGLATAATASSPVSSYPITAAAGTLGAANYSFNFVNGTLTVTKAGQTITFGVLPAKTYGDPSFSLDATTTSGLNISYTSSNPSVALVSGTTLTIVGTGSAVITASQEGDGNYHAAVSVAQALTVNKATAIVTLGSLNTTYDGTPKAATATTVPAGLNVTFTYNGAATAPTAVGSYSVVGIVSDPNYQGSASGTLTIAKGNQTITFGALPVKTYGNDPFTLSANASSGLGVTYTSSNSAVATVSGSTVTIVGAGSTTIIANQAGNANYNAAPAVNQTLTVNKAVATITFGQLIFTYNNDIPMPVTVTTIPAGLAVTITYDGSPDPPFDVGSYTVVATVVDANYQGTATAIEEIARRNQTITFNPLPVKTYGDAAFNLTATASSGLTVTYISSNTAVATISTTKPYKVTIVGAGTSIITAYQVGNKRWNDAPPVAQTLTVNKAAGTVTLGSLSATYDGSAKAATATTTPAGRSVTFTYNGSATVPIAAGSYSVIGTISDSNYQGSASGTLVIAKTGQTISFGALPAMSYGTAPFNPTATSTSGLAISYTSSNPAVATTSGTTVTIVGVGTTTITASQGGDGNYTAATAVPQTLTVGKGTATITLGSLSTSYNSTPRAATTTTMPNGLPVTLTYNGSATAPTAAGSYTVSATVDSPNYQGSSTGTLTIAKGTQTITFGSLPIKTVGNAPFALTATSTSGLAINYTSSNPAVATISGTTVTIVGAGTTTITAIQVGDGNYDAAGSVAQTLMVNAAQASSGKTTVTIAAVTSYFDTVAATLAAIPPGSTVQVKLQTLTFAEAVNLNISGATVSISGGYDVAFTNVTGMTSIQGNLTISSGTLVADRLVIM